MIKCKKENLFEQEHSLLSGTGVVTQIPQQNVPLAYHLALQWTICMYACICSEPSGSSGQVTVRSARDVLDGDADKR